VLIFLLPRSHAAAVASRLRAPRRSVARVLLLYLLLGVASVLMLMLPLHAHGLTQKKTWPNFLDFDTVAFSFLFDKHCPIMK